MHTLAFYDYCWWIVANIQVRFVPTAGVMLINDEVVWLDSTFSQFLLQNDNDNWEP